MIRFAGLERRLWVMALVLPGALAAADRSAERRVLTYIREQVRPGEPLYITELYNNVFTDPEERKALNKLYNAFFRIPLFVVRHREKFGAPPSLKTISEQFDLENTSGADTLLRVMESDPRVPRFLTRDGTTGEIVSVEVERIRSDPRFSQALERQLSEWEGRPAPDFKLVDLEGAAVESRALRGKVVLVYVWFTGCPPCLRVTPDLVALGRELAGRGFAIVGANADRFLGLGYDDEARRRYAAEQKIDFPIVHWTAASDAAYGKIAIFPTLFLVDRNGMIIRHWIGYVSPAELRAAVSARLKD